MANRGFNIVPTPITAVVGGVAIIPFIMGNFELPGDAQYQIQLLGSGFFWYKVISEIWDVLIRIDTETAPFMDLQNIGTGDNQRIRP